MSVHFGLRLRTRWPETLADFHFILGESSCALRLFFLCQILTKELSPFCLCSTWFDSLRQFRESSAWTNYFCYRFLTYSTFFQTALTVVDLTMPLLLLLCFICLCLCIEFCGCASHRLRFLAVTRWIDIACWAWPLICWNYNSRSRFISNCGSGGL